MWRRRVAHTHTHSAPCSVHAPYHQKSAFAIVAAFVPASTNPPQEEENLDLAQRNAQMQQRIEELEALAAAAEAAAAQAQAQQQVQDDSSPEPCTPQHQRMCGGVMVGMAADGDEGGDGDGGCDSMQERATSVLKRAAAASRLSGMYQVRQTETALCLSMLASCARWLACGRTCALTKTLPESMQACQHLQLVVVLTLESSATFV